MKFDRIIRKFMQKWEIKGASFALMKNDRLIYSKGYGFADEEENVPMDIMHVFRIASISKLITAVAIMKLQEEGKLTLQDRVFGPEGILNDTIFSDIKDPRTTKITVENLLRHQGGFSIAYGDPMFCPVEIARKMQVPPPADLNTMIRFVLSRRLGFTPGSGARYSNIGYGILSKVIEKVSGEDYELYVKRHILRPAGCFDMHLGKNLYDDKLPNEVKYYEVSNAEQIQACDGSGKLVARSNGGNNIEELYGAGGWVASPAELLRFLAVIDKDPGIPDLLSDASIDYMTQEVPSAYPIGWIETTSRGEWFRSGTLAGTSALMKKQKDGYSWVFLTNTSSWKGSRFPHYIDNAVRQAMASVHSWPERDLFEMQRFDHEKLLVIR
ncbi:serine hydrolase [Odoribacter splanchnicus]|nr:serine hydrolase domain-containing protein [Odoribacter splanchnicus]MDB9247084.1 serine hydrolase [Odoribacter splanchnicus]